MMVLDGDEIIRMKFSVLKATIFPIKITSDKAIQFLDTCLYNDDYDGAYEYLCEYIRETIRYNNIVLKNYPQVIRTAASKREVSIGFLIESKKELNKIKISNTDLAEKIRNVYDIRM